ncbi:hypothetical protein CR513_04308, partial [Mucuna pruriens]
MQQNMKIKVGEISYQLSLPPTFANLYNIFHVSQNHKYIHDPLHVIKLDNVQVKDNLSYKVLPLRIEDQSTKWLRRKEILLDFNEQCNLGVGKSNDKLVSGVVRSM